MLQEINFPLRFIHWGVVVCASLPFYFFKYSGEFFLVSDSNGNRNIILSKNQCFTDNSVVISNNKMKLTITQKSRHINNI